MLKTPESIRNLSWVEISSTILIVVSNVTRTCLLREMITGVRQSMNYQSANFSYPPPKHTHTLSLFTSTPLTNRSF